MRLTHVEIENFKGIGTKQSIDLAPITLLFGPNSAGKSTILQALHYLREILERQNPDPDQTIAGGLTDLGGFSALVHNHDLTLPISIKVRVEMTEGQGHEYLALNSGENISGPEFQRLGLRYLVGENTELKDYAVVQEIGLGIEVRWSDLIRAPFVSKLKVEMDGEPIAEIHSSAQEGRAQITDFNFAHPLLQEALDISDFVPLENLSDVDIAYTPLAEDVEFDASDPFSSPLGIEIWELSKELSADSSADYDGEFRVAVETEIGALPRLGQQLGLDLLEINESRIKEHYAAGTVMHRFTTDAERTAAESIDTERLRRAGLASLLDELILGPARIVCDYLNSTTYIGPLRDIPNRGYRPRLSPDESRWAKGLAAWDALYLPSNKYLFDAVNEWMSSDEYLRTGYRLVRTDFKQISTNTGLHRLFMRGITEDDIGDLQDLYEAVPSKIEIGLMDVARGVRVAPNDVGVGISQMLPVVVACLMDPVGLISIEQPELHIHPAIQVGMGDLFIAAVAGTQPAVGAERTLLVETHSEHIMLRLLRRIREQTDDELPPGVRGIGPKDVSVIYVENTDQGVEFKRLRITPDGDFADRWPRGFFDERAEELF